MTPEACFEELQGKLRGAMITDRQLAGSSLSIWVATNPDQDTGYTIWCDAAWRLTGPDGILAGSTQAQDEAADSGWSAASDAIDVMVGRTVEHLDIDRATGDLLLALSGSLQVRTLNSDPRAEMLWWIRDRARRLHLSGSPAGVALDAAA